MKKQMLRAVVALVLGVVLCIVVGRSFYVVGDAFGAHIGFFVITVLLASVGTWHVLGRVWPSQSAIRRQSGPPLQMREEGEWTIIDARSSPMPKRGPVLAVVAPGFLGIFIILHGAVLAGALTWATLTGLLMFAMRRGNKHQRHADMGPFAVSPQSLRLPNGTIIDRRRVYQYSTRNTEDGRVLVYGSTSTLGRSGQIGAAMTHHRMLGISYAVVVEHEGTLSWLAGGLTEELAHAVLEEVARPRQSLRERMAESVARVEAADRKAKASFELAMNTHQKEKHAGDE